MTHSNSIIRGYFLLKSYMTKEKSNSVHGIFRIGEEIEKPNQIEVFAYPSVAVIPSWKVEKQKSGRQKYNLKENKLHS